MLGKECIKYRDENGDLWIEWCERFGNGFHTANYNVSAEALKYGWNEDKLADLLSELHHDYDVGTDTIGSD